MKQIFLRIIFAAIFCGFAFAQESQSLQILEKPIPQLPKSYGGSIHVEGTITLKVEFLANGLIGKVTPVSSLPYGLTENAVEAAKKIKFVPAKKDGVFRTLSKTISYNYISGGWQNTLSQSDGNKKDDVKTDEKAEIILKKVVEKLGGEKYLQVKSIVGRGRFSAFGDGSALLSSQSFVDVIAYPDKERTEFKGSGTRTVQTNTGDTGWIFDGNAETINLQNKDQIESFRRSLRVSLDNLLRENWRGKATLSYVGKRPATLGKRSEVVKLTFDDGLAVEFEFSDEFLPIKSVYKRTNAAQEEVKEEDRYAQFVDFQGVKTPLIVDHFSNGAQVSRINYESVEFNKKIPDSIFIKPNSAKDLKKDLKL